MKERKPLILVSNDDGVTAKGINELIKYLRPLGEIVVMAPDSARSGQACAITVTRPVHYELISQEPGLTIYSCTGTPVDCIKLARYTVLDRDPDLIVAGINHGDNSGTNVHYSGTMGAVVEGCLNGIPSIGYSLCSHDCDADFSPCESYVQAITAMVLDKGLPPEVCLNVNFPHLQDIKGLKVCKQAFGRWVREWDACPRKGDDRYYWLSGAFVCDEPQNEETDNWALAHGYVAITPTKMDVTAYGFVEELRERLS
ncbi:5'/3'-nucleotidase SurE [Bacteroides sp. OttesenSCG-928-E20]|nr:5'/3'-nucleotidase SurE [Bacteroides sp. OttesenSCG-928-N06]MDL2299353.1 5'/3'-nucleotidase SurE [Bacteroides sp. OttesenSCG-928-E20]MDL2304691.1 5'/3'-nucleotidase SurE [Bacteroides sp. OttesenSCG-928-D19]